jgi:hypothetical protein
MDAKHKHVDGDSDVIVKDTGVLVNGHHPKTDVHHKGVGKKKGAIDDVVPSHYDDGVCRVDLSDAPTWTIQFGAFALKFDGNLINVDFNGSNGQADKDDDWFVDGETFANIKLTTFDKAVKPVIQLSRPIDASKGFTVVGK